MSKKTSKEESNLKQFDDTVLKDVDSWAIECKIDSSVFAGVKMLMGWKKGKQLTEKAFKEAIRKFNKKSC